MSKNIVDVSKANKSDALEIIRRKVEDTVDKQHDVGRATQGAAAGILAIASGLGWSFIAKSRGKDASAVARTLASEVLRQWHENSVSAIKESENGATAAQSALRDAVIGNNPLGSESADAQGAKTQTAKSVRLGGRWADKRTAFNNAWALACKLAFLGYTHLAYHAGTGFSVKKKHIAPVVVIKDVTWKTQPLGGNDNDTVVLNPATSTQFVATNKGVTKIPPVTRHSVEAFMRSGRDPQKGRATGQSVAKAAKWLTANMSTTTKYSKEDMNTLNALSIRLASVIAMQEKLAKVDKKKKPIAKSVVSKGANVSNVTEPTLPETKVA